MPACFRWASVESRLLHLCTLCTCIHTYIYIYIYMHNSNFKCIHVMQCKRHDAKSMFPARSRPRVEECLEFLSTPSQYMPVHHRIKSCRHRSWDASITKTTASQPDGYEAWSCTVILPAEAWIEPDPAKQPRRQAGKSFVPQKCPRVIVNAD